MKAAGCRMLLDGFGYKSTTFAALKAVRFDYLKIDGAIVRTRALEKWEFAYLPSGTVLRTLRGAGRRTERRDRIVALGDPDYPVAPAGTPVTPPEPEATLRGVETLPRLAHSAEEARAVAGFFPGEGRAVLLRGGATAAAVTGAVRDAGDRLAAVHLACHGYVDDQRPRLTGLVLAGGEIFSVDDISRASIPADLAVLSACSTARGRHVRGEGVVGLVRAVFLAGCPRVVVSDWAVPDQGTRVLMERFYRAWRERGLAPAAALREAKLSILREGGAAAHPSRWAGFVLWGLPE